jgi:alkaline phosphatase D
MSQTRRDVIVGATSMGLGLALAPRVALSASAHPFSLGIASGEPWPDGVVLWTRLIRDALAPDGGMGAAPVEVTWEVARDEHMKDVVRSGVTLAMPDVAHSIHLEVMGLQPARWYWYRFRAQGVESPIGRTRTAPAPGAPLSSLTFAAACCQHWMYGNWAAYRRMVEEKIDFILHLGDYIYESPSSSAAAVKQIVRQVPFEIPKTLGDYRRVHAHYKTDPAIQAAHAAFPWIMTWDDHEVENDYTGSSNERRLALFDLLQQRAAAYQAYWEHMPLRLAQRPLGPDALMYRRFVFGDLMDLIMLDERQYRSTLPCPPAPPARDRSRRVALEDCPDALDPKRSMLGLDQEQWLAKCLAEPARARWSVIGQQMLFAPHLSKTKEDKFAIRTDGWDGYAAPHQRMLDLIAARPNRDSLVIGGDIHAFIATNVPAKRDDPTSPAIASHVVIGPISSRLGDHASLEASRPHNPHIKFADARRHGYTRCTLTRDRALFEFRALDDVKETNSGISTMASFETEWGKAGLRQV